MSKFRFREYDALGLRKRVPGDQLPSAHHVAKRKQKQKDLEVVFDPKDYREYATGFRKRKNQRRQDALKQIKEKERLERNQERAEKRTKLKEQLGLADNYGVESSSEEEDGEAEARPRSVTVYEGDGGLTTTVTTTALQSSDDELPASSGSDGDADSDEDGEEDRGRGGRAGRGAGSLRKSSKLQGVGRSDKRARPGTGKPSKGQKGGQQARPTSGKQHVLQGGVRKGKKGGKKPR